MNMGSQPVKPATGNRCSNYANQTPETRSPDGSLSSDSLFSSPNLGNSALDDTAFFDAYFWNSISEDTGHTKPLGDIPLDWSGFDNAVNGTKQGDVAVGASQGNGNLAANPLPSTVDPQQLIESTDSRARYTSDFSDNAATELVQHTADAGRPYSMTPTSSTNITIPSGLAGFISNDAGACTSTMQQPAQRHQVMKSPVPTKVGSRKSPISAVPKAAIRTAATHRSLGTAPGVEKYSHPLTIMSGIQQNNYAPRVAEPVRWDPTPLHVPQGKQFGQSTYEGQLRHVLLMARKEVDELRSRLILSQRNELAAQRRVNNFAEMLSRNSQSLNRLAAQIKNLEWCLNRSGYAVTTT